MITITRRLAMQFRKIARQALNLSSRGPLPSVGFQTGPDGFRARVTAYGMAVEYHVPGDHPIEGIPVSFELLADVEGRKDEPVTLEVERDNRITASWRDGSVPQMTQYDAVEPVDPAEFPGMPETLTKNPPRLLEALHHAFHTTNPDPSRYATDHLLLDGASGRIVATDGRQLLVQHGFQFPWDVEALVPGNKVFGCRELPQEEPVAIGKTDTKLAVRTGPWTIWLPVHDDVRFPDTTHHIPRTDAAMARFQVAPTDADFLAKSLPRLPGDEDYNFPVTVELNGKVTIRAKATDGSEATELLLANSTASGEPVLLNTNRRFLLRAVKLGFDQVHVMSPKSPVLCQDRDRQYVWALLNPESALGPIEGAVRVESPPAEESAPAGEKSRTRQSRPRKRKAAMPGPKPPRSSRAKTNGQPRPATHDKADPQDVTELIQQAESVRASLRDAASKTTELVRSLKRHRKQSKLVAGALASLRQLSALERGSPQTKSQRP